jgi:3-oxoacyl-[acyl-carrier-protein] synthase II
VARRVVVTGLGLVAPLGMGREEVWRRLLAGECGTRRVASFEPDAYGADQGGEVIDFDPAPYFERTDPGSAGRASQLAVAASRLALDDSGLDAERLDPRRVGVAMGTTSGEAQEVEAFDDHLIPDRAASEPTEFVKRYPCNVIPELIASELEVTGPNLMIPAACAAGTYALAYALDTVRLGRADVMLAGGADCFSRITYAGFARLGAVAPERCQPFDRDRQGMIPAEGAGVLVLESLAAARSRGARIYAEVAGYGLACDAHHMTAAHPQADGAARAMGQALGQSGLNVCDIGYISAHGTGTATNDRLEAMAVRRVFNGRSRTLPISSIKSMIGHTMGAASAIEAAVCSLAVSEGRIPPTIHFEEPDPECDLDCVPNEARELPVSAAMNNSYAFGGYNASMIFRSCES